MALGARARAFVAVNLPAQVCAHVGAAQARLKGLGADVKWVAPDTFHFTLKFLGEVDRANLDSIAQALQSALDGAEAFRVSLRGLGAFPNAGRPRVIWVGLQEGREQLHELAERVESALVPLGFERETRPFGGHLTLGRVRSPQGAQRLAEALAEPPQQALGSMCVERVALMESELRREGARYTALREFALEAAKEAARACASG